jgi:hypothetical protein
MNSWFSSNLGDPLLAGKMLDRIDALFRTESARANAPHDMAVFVRHEAEGRLHCEVMVYFSPAAAVVASAVGAARCERPSPQDLGLLAGCEGSWSALFPETCG